MRLLLFLIGSLASAQTFEVATIKPAERLSPQEVVAAQTGMKISAGQATFRYRSLRDLIALAYKVENPYVVEEQGLAGGAFDIQAKLPAGSTRQQIPAMLHALLEERFQLKAHREKRPQDVYFLEQAKGGHKMKDAPPPQAEEPDPAQGFEMPKSIRIPGVKRTPRGATPVDGLREEWARMTMAELTSYISPMLDRRVVDRTGLTGSYQVMLELSFGEMTQALISNSNAGPATFRPAPGIASDPSGASIPASLKKLGLTLEKGKGELEVIVVDSVEIMPTEN